MTSKILFRALLSSIVLLGLAGCAEFDARKGPDPVINAAAVQAASANNYWILDALAKDANVHDGNPDYYYLVAEAGFNYVDDQCRDYFDRLFFIDRGRSQIKSGLATTSATTAAILGVTQASAPSLAIVAAAFGLASAATDIATGTYLYALPPAATQGLVTKLQAAYRDEAAKIHRLITSPTAAYHHIQSYLSLCLPPTIEAEVTKRVSQAGAQANVGTSGSTITVESTGGPPSGIRPVVLLRSARTPLPATASPPPVSLPPNVMNNFEFRLSRNPELIRTIQSTVCVKNPDGKLGPVGSETRKNIVEFFEGFGTPRPDIDSTAGGLMVKDRQILKKAFDETTGGKGCIASNFKNPKQVGEFTH